MRGGAINARDYRASQPQQSEFGIGDLAFHTPLGCDDIGSPALEGSIGVKVENALSIPDDGRYDGAPGAEVPRAWQNPAYPRNFPFRPNGKSALLGSCTLSPHPEVKSREWKGPADQKCKIGTAPLGICGRLHIRPGSGAVKGNPSGQICTCRMTLELEHHGMSLLLYTRRGGPTLPCRGSHRYICIGSTTMHGISLWKM